MFCLQQKHVPMIMFHAHFLFDTKVEASTHALLLMEEPGVLLTTTLKAVGVTANNAQHSKD